MICRPCTVPMIESDALGAGWSLTSAIQTYNGILFENPLNRQIRILGFVPQSRFRIAELSMKDDEIHMEECAMSVTGSRRP